MAHAASALSWTHEEFLEHQRRSKVKRKRHEIGQGVADQMRSAFSYGYMKLRFAIRIESTLDQVTACDRKAVQIALELRERAHEIDQAFRILAGRIPNGDELLHSRGIALQPLAAAG